MPANLSPDYKKAEMAFRRAREPREQLDCLREMLRTIPKHKGTDHLQADIKTRIRELTEQLSGPAKGAARTEPATVIRPEGAAQVALLGPPNSGKSTLHDRLTRSHAATGPYPFTTLYPQPGMAPYEDITIQLVDLPPITTEHPVPWIGNAVQQADGALLVVDLGHPGVVEEVVALHEILAGRKVHLIDRWPSTHPGAVESEDLFATHLPTLLVVNKVDDLEDPDAELAAFAELTGYTYPVLLVDAAGDTGIDTVAARLFDLLGIVRVYTKVPGGAPDLGRPFTVRSGETVLDIARLVHRDLAASLTYARLWRSGEPDGMQVGRDHPVQDGDILELHEGRG